MGKWKKMDFDTVSGLVTDENCPKVGTGELDKSDFTKYEKRGIWKERNMKREE